MKIYLIGMPGSGKSTLGKEIAELLGYAYVDTDACIESREKRSIRTIFEELGEVYFRQQEHDCLQRTLGWQKTVIATGGGLPCFFNNLALMQQHGITIFIDVPLPVLIQRLETNNDRPLLGANKAHQLEQLYTARISQYRQAQYTFIQPTAAEIVAFLQSQSLLD